MKTLLLTLSSVLFYSASTFAAPASVEAWQDLQPDDQITLAQALSLPATRGGTVEVKSGDAYLIDDVAGLDGMSVVQYTLHAAQCTDVDAASDMELVLANGMPADSKAEVGVVFGPNCQMEVYVETKDLSTPSFFQK